MKRQLRPIPLIVVTGVHVEAMAALTVGIQWDLPRSVVVQHHIDVDDITLTRTVSDAGGTLEQEVIDLEHLCVGCALREDIVPTIERLANTARWESMVVHLPVSAEARHLCRVIADSRALRRLVRVAAVVTAVNGPTAAEDLLGDGTLLDAGAEVVPDDDRGLGEVLAAQIEYADVIVCVEGCGDAARELLTALARPDAQVYAGEFLPGGDALLAVAHDTDRSEAWTEATLRDELPPLPGHAVWRLDLHADRPFHPDRFMEEIDALGSGRHRSRGCFWLATRPHEVCVWDGCGGHLNIGVVDGWDDELRPSTRLIITGDWSSDEVNQLAVRFQRCLLTDTELAERGPAWEVAEDGFEPWLGDIEREPAPLDLRRSAS